MRLVLDQNGEVVLDQDSKAATGAGMFLAPDEKGEISLMPRPEDRTDPGVPGIAAMRKHLLNAEPLTPGQQEYYSRLGLTGATGYGGRWSEEAPPVPLDPNALAASTIATRRPFNAPSAPAPRRPTNAVDEAWEAYRRLEQEEDIRNPLRTISSPTNFALSAAKGLSNAILGAPSDIADLASYPVRYAQGQPPTAQPFTGRGSYILNRTGPEADVPMYGAAPRLTTEDIGARMAAHQVGGYDVAQERQRVAEEARAEQFPVGTPAGELTGELGALALARSPFSPALRRRAVEAGKQIERAEKVARVRSKITSDRDEAFKKIAASPGWLKLVRGAERAAESGVEGAALGILNEGDPVKSAAFTAGTQAVLGGTTGALLHNWAKGFPGGKAVSLAANLAVLTGTLYVAHTVLPGQVKDYEAQKAAAQKIIGGWLTGAATGAVSSRGRTGKLSAVFPKLTDALGSAPRNTMQNYLVDYFGRDEAGRRVFQQRLEQLQERLPSLDDAQRQRLQAAYNRGVSALDREMMRIFGQ